MWLIASDEVEDCWYLEVSYSQPESLLCVQCWCHAGADQSKEDKQGNTKKRQIELGAATANGVEGGGFPV